MLICVWGLVFSRESQVRHWTLFRKVQMCHMHKNGMFIGKGIFCDHVLTGRDRQGKVYIQFIHKSVNAFVGLIDICAACIQMFDVIVIIHNNNCIRSDRILL